MKRTALLLLSALTVAACAPAPPSPRTRAGSLAFACDVATFFDGVGPARTDLMLAVPFTALHFAQRDGARPTTAIEVTAVVYDEEGRQVTGDDWSYPELPGSLRRDDNEGKRLSRRYPFRLPPGRYRAEVRVFETPTGAAGAIELRFTVPDFANEPLSASDPVFGLCPDMVLAAPADEYVGGVLPHPSRRYGEDAPRMCVHWEVYDGTGGGEGEYRLRYRVKDDRGEVREDSSSALPRRDGRGGITVTPRLTGLHLGEYRLELEARLGDLAVRREAAFTVDESRIGFIQDAEKLRTVLSYVATNEELRVLNDAPDDSLSSFWRQFWRRRDPNPDDRGNEALVEFLRRVEYASRNLGVLEPGWRSDMGRVYIKYGAPDNVDRSVNDPYRPPTEIWYYYARNATYVFQDLEGFGRYRLVGTQRD